MATLLLFYIVQKSTSTEVTQIRFLLYEISSLNITCRWCRYHATSSPVRHVVPVVEN